MCIGRYQLYTGNVYRFHDPTMLFAALGRLKREKTPGVEAGSVVVRFLGAEAESVLPAATRCGAADLGPSGRSERGSSRSVHTALTAGVGARTMKTFHPSDDFPDLDAMASIGGGGALVAHYPLDGDAADASGSGKDGTVFGATPTIPPAWSES